MQVLVGFANYINIVPASSVNDPVIVTLGFSGINSYFRIGTATSEFWVSTGQRNLGSNIVGASPISQRYYNNSTVKQGYGFKTIQFSTIFTDGGII
jgi:hypothetical protein